VKEIHPAYGAPEGLGRTECREDSVLSSTGGIDRSDHANSRRHKAGTSEPLHCSPKIEYVTNVSAIQLVLEELHMHAGTTNDPSGSMRNESDH